MNCRRAVISWAGAALLLAGCTTATPAPDLSGLLPTPLLLLGEQHDAPDHQRLQRQTLRQLAERGQLAALVLEMVERDRQTSGLPPDASETRVREALDWTGEQNAGAWSWAVYGPLVMDAVRASVPVLGGNLPRAQMRAVMGESGLDTTLPAAALQQQRENIRTGHCGLLPESQIVPMTRIQLARDRALAQTAQQALRTGQTVLLVAGHQHVRRDIGVPQHLPPDQPLQVVVALAGADASGGSAADRVWRTAPTTPVDHCAELRQQWGQGPR
ncbi:MAG: ChaN family lipoprotein [Hydrogenophaga sp.]|uniref:ChaN family lipoprotein n=1 Tax=Hydrogenophaga sp. TaxID=1904254 RepID=UPI003D9B7B41